MGMMKEFKEFAMKGNLIDLAVGFVMGAAFTKITTAFINGMIMIPLLFLYYYSPYSSNENLLIVILVVISIMLLVRLIKGLFLVLSETKFSRFYLFVYLCILEFIPLIIIYKSLI